MSGDEKRIGRPTAPNKDEVIGSNMRISKVTRDRLAAEAERRCVGRNLIIERALTEWLDRAEKVEL